MQIRKVFLSSTARDLQEYREAAYKAIEGLDGYHCVRMEDFGARNKEADEFCNAKVSECDLFVGIVGHLYGSCPKGSETSYTEREYNTATDASKPRLIFVAPENFPISAELMESDDKREKQKSFRERVNKDRTRADFSSPDNLALKVTQAIQNEITNTRKEETSIPLQRSPRSKLLIGREEELETLIPNQIPRPPDDFKGREDEINEILSNFDKGATITGLRGMAGVGKTALALVLVERLKDRFPDGNLILNLKGTTKSPLSAAEAMAQVIHSYYPTDRLPENENELHGLYLSVLAGKHALLLLDNASDKEQVEPLLPPSNCAVLITSRNKFALPGLKERDLDVLHPEESRELLLEIAGRIGDRADSLAMLCGYLPLALRNAASALAERKDISVDDYERRLSDKKVRLKLVDASFSLSYDLLRPLRRKHWCRLSVFPGDFDLNGGAAVLKMSHDASAEALSDLVKWSLVDFIRPIDSGEGRYRLHDLARLFAESRLESKERDDAKQRHTKHYLKALSDADKLYDKGGKNILAGLMHFDQEWANIKEGQAWAEAVMQKVTKPEAKSDQEFALHMADSYPIEGRNVLSLRQHPPDRIRWLETALTAARLMKNLDSEAMHLANLGPVYAAMGEVRKAIKYHYQALAINREIGNMQGEGAVLNNLGLAYSDLGEVRKAVEYFDQALAISRGIGNRRGEKSDLGNLGNAYFLRGDVLKAIEYYDQALAISREIGDRRSEGIGLGNLGNAYFLCGNVRKAIEYYDQALAISREIGDRRGEGDHLSNLGSAYHNLGEVHKAIEYHDQALAINRKIGYRRGEVGDLSSLGRDYLDLGEVCKAIDYYEQSLEIARKIEYRRGEGDALFSMGLALEKLGQRPEAIDRVKAALGIFEQIESPSAEKVRRKLSEWQG